MFEEISTARCYHGVLREGMTHHLDIKEWSDTILGKQPQDTYDIIDSGHPPPDADVSEIKVDEHTTGVVCTFKKIQQIALGYDSVGHVKYVGKFTHMALNAMSSLLPGVVQLCI